MEKIDFNWLYWVLTVGLPLLTGLVTKQVAHKGVKAVVLAALSVLGGMLNEAYSQGFESFDWSAGWVNAVALFLAAVGAHFGLLKPVALTGTHGAVQRNVPGGIGGKTQRS